jgi:hypothetical protein
MESKLTSEEYAQIMQTIEMFEVISQAEPGDCQSYDILKEAYLKIGQNEAALQVSRKLAEAYLHMGLYSSALLECEGILQQQPDSPDIIALVGEIESRTQNRPAAGGTAKANGVNGANGRHSTPIGLPLDEQNNFSDLIALGKNRRLGEIVDPEDALATDDGNESFARFMVQNRIVSEEHAVAALARVRQLNASVAKSGGNTIAVSLLDELVRISGKDADQLLSGLIDATRFGFIPLEYYDIDRSVVRTLPESLTLGRLIVPFDIVSRTMMIAICNPFDGLAKEIAQSHLDYHIQWYLAKPDAMARVLRDVYRLDARD